MPVTSSYRSLTSLHHRSGRLRKVLERLQTRLVNPVVGWLLRGALHDLLSASIVLLRIRGRRSGMTYMVPAMYAEKGDVLILISRRSRNWWRNLEGADAVPLVLRGEERTGRPAVVHDLDGVRTAVRTIGHVTGRTGKDPIPVGEAVAVTIHLGPRPAAGTARPTGTALWRRWFGAVTLGEFAGFAVPAIVGAAVAGPMWTPLGIGPLLQAVTIVVAGVIEGCVLGLAQAYALRAALPEIATRDWVRATAWGAAVAWLIGSLPMVLGDRFTQLSPLLLGTLGVILLVSMGILQWRVLRRHVPRASTWIAATAGSWLVALGVFALVTTPLWQEGQPGWLVALIGLFGGAVMAATVAALTGLALVRMVSRHRTARRNG